MASVRSSLRSRARAMVRAIWATSRVWVRRVTKWSPCAATNTWVLCLRRRKALLWMTRSRSRWNSVRTEEGSSGRSRPRLAALLAAKGERWPSRSSSRARTDSWGRPDALGMPWALYPPVAGREKGATGGAKMLLHCRGENRRRKAAESENMALVRRFCEAWSRRDGEEIYLNEAQLGHAGVNDDLLGLEVQLHAPALEGLGADDDLFRQPFDDHELVREPVALQDKVQAYPLGSCQSLAVLSRAKGLRFGERHNDLHLPSDVRPDAGVGGAA